MIVKEKTELEVTVDKRHIVTIGERLYTESVELLRELVNNAYDADAERVDVEITPERISVSDSGTGMDLEGLRQYFNIGSEEKVVHARSPKYGRVRIGQFGIGKFASLAAASRFEVITQFKEFAARVVFDKNHWQASQGAWHLPLEILEPHPERGNGTTVILSNLSKSFNPEEVEKKLMESTPLKAPYFEVYINGRRLMPRSLSGRNIPILEACPFGHITGEIVIVPASMSSLQELGIEIKVKGVTVKRALFGMETWGKVIARIRGEINADFLPITSDRSNFVVDSPEYRAFVKVMAGIMPEVKKILGKEADQRQDRRAGRVVKETLQRIHRSLARNPDLSPFGPIPYGDEMGAGTGAVFKPKDDEEAKKSDTEIKPKAAAEPEKQPQRTKRRNPLVKKITPNAIVRRMRMGDSSVSVCLDFFGDSGPECFSEGNIVYLNRDHPLYKRESQKPTTYTMYIARLLTQEISLMHETRSPRLAFTRQSKLLKDAFTDD
ncbi:MAG: ATP-binding protein [Candidatus Aminicenantaceae bacterium]